MAPASEARVIARPAFMFARIVFAKSGCWLWTGSGNGAMRGDYGMLHIDGRWAMAHRVSYEMFRGPIPTGLVIDHLCRTHRCVRPDHLEAVTNGENVLRGVGLTAQHAKRTTCLQGHPLDAIRMCHGVPCRYCRTCSILKCRAMRASAKAKREAQ